MKKNIIICIILLLPISIFAQKKHKSAISIGPATLNYKLSQGESNTQTVYVHNKLNRPYYFSLELSDWGLDSNGNDINYPPGAHPNSLSKWITLDKKTFVVPPHSKESINVTLTIPDSAGADQSARWAMLNIITTTERKAPKNQGAVDYMVDRSLAVGVRLYQAPVNGTSITKEIKMLGFKPLQDSTIYRIESQNRGSVILRCLYSIELSSQETGEKITIGPKESIVLPGQIRYVDLKLSNDIPPGKYSAIALIEPGDDEIPLEAAQTEIVIK